VRAAVLREIGTPVAIEDVDLERPHGGEVRVRVKAAGVCHSDYHFVTGDLPKQLPFVLGHEGAGVILETAAGITSVVPGDHVVLLWRTSCGRCAACQTGRPVLCATGSAARMRGVLDDGTSRLSRGGEVLFHNVAVSCLAEEVVTGERSVLKIPNDVPFEIAAVIGCAVMTGVGAAVNTARVHPGSSVLVIGAGGIGQCVVMGARLAGAGRIVVADVVRAKLEMTTALGATDLVDTSDADLVESVRALTDGGVDYAFEAIGRGELVGGAVRSLRPGGTAVAIGYGSSAQRIDIPMNDLVRNEWVLRGSAYGSTRPAADIPMIIDLYRSGRLPLDRLVSRRYRLDDLNEAFRAMLAGEVARSVVIP
jgi:Zn-dependent alcohol dehydrogenase